MVRRRLEECENQRLFLRRPVVVVVVVVVVALVIEFESRLLSASNRRRLQFHRRTDIRLVAPMSSFRTISRPDQCLALSVPL
jgi:hypothetical protein